LGRILLICPRCGFETRDLDQYVTQKHGPECTRTPPFPVENEEMR